jgi:DNA-directed RNA polymerase specialized sigma24 family protein
MPSTCEGSVTRWIVVLQGKNPEQQIDPISGGEAAAQHLWDRYFDRLVRLTRRKFRARAGGVAEDEEDAALKAFESVFSHVAHGRFRRLNDRHDLWRLVAKITVRKALSQIERQGAIKRGGCRLVNEAGLAGRDTSNAGPGLDGFVGREPRPDLLAIAGDEYQRLWSKLGNDSLRRVLELSLEGYSREEIAARIWFSTKTVDRKLEAIRTVWLEGEDRS